VSEHPADAFYRYSLAEGHRRERVVARVESEWLSKEKQTGEDKT